MPHLIIKEALKMMRASLPSTLYLEETIKRIFEPYFTKKEVGKGSGLVLSVIHGIVKDYKGIIRVESEPGKGSVFHIYLPVLEEDLPSRENIQKEIQGGTEKILVVS